MPYIEAKLTVTLSENQKDDLQKKLSNSTSTVLSKPKAYIMTNIEDNKSLYMNEKKLDKGAYVSIKMLGNPAKSSCETLTKEICKTLSEYGIEGTNIYISYHPAELWGWNNSMF